MANLMDVFRKLSELNFEFGKTSYSGLEAQLIWQYLRYNVRYRIDHDNLVKAENDPQYEDQYNELKFDFLKRWRISEPLAPGIEILPAETFFQVPKPIEEVPEEPMMVELVSEIVSMDPFTLDGRQLTDPALYRPLIDLRRNKTEIIRELEHEIDERQKELKVDAANRESAYKASLVKVLVSRPLVYHLREVEGLMPKELSVKLHDILPNSSVSSHSNAQKLQAEAFLSTAQKSPGFFFLDQVK